MAAGDDGVEQVAALQELGDHDYPVALDEEFVQLDNVRRVHVREETNLVEDLLLERALPRLRELDDLHGVIRAVNFVRRAANLGEPSAPDGLSEMVQFRDGLRVRPSALDLATGALAVHAAVDRGGVENLILRRSEAEKGGGETTRRGAEAWGGRDGRGGAMTNSRVRRTARITHHRRRPAPHGGRVAILPTVPCEPAPFTSVGRRVGAPGTARYRSNKGMRCVESGEGRGLFFVPRSNLRLMQTTHSYKRVFLTAVSVMISGNTSRDVSPRRGSVR